MEKKQIDLLVNRLIKQVQKCNGIEPDSIKFKNDLKFCNDFFKSNSIDFEKTDNLLMEAINNHNELELDLLLMLLVHFKTTKLFDVKIAPLLIQPWHHFHDRIASILEFDHNEKTTDFLFLGAVYTCDNLNYESDYCEFNRKCLYGLLKIGTEKSIQYIKQIASCNNTVIANHAKIMIKKYNL